MKIREFDWSRGLASLRSLLVELQDYEHGLDSRKPTGEESTDAYLDFALEQCREYAGRILVAESDEAGPDRRRVVRVGLVIVWTRYRSGEPNDIAGEQAYIPDVVVAASHRGRGIGRALLRAAESLARESGADRLGIGVLASNTAAKSLYLAEGFAESEISLEKRLDAQDAPTEPA